jgi:hypothetical protein
MKSAVSQSSGYVGTPACVSGASTPITAGSSIFFLQLKQTAHSAKNNKEGLIIFINVVLEVA